MKTRTATFAAALAACLFAAPGFASDAAAGASVEVKYRDLDLSTTAGTDELNRRLDKAAREVCGLDVVTTGTRISSREGRRCYNETKAQLETHVAALTDQARS